MPEWDTVNYGGYAENTNITSNSLADADQQYDMINNYGGKFYSRKPTHKQPESEYIQYDEYGTQNYKQYLADDSSYIDEVSDNNNHYYSQYQQDLPEDYVKQVDVDNDQIANTSYNGYVDNAAEVVDVEAEQPYVIAPYSQEEINNKIFIQHVEGKGRCMFALQEYRPGDVIFVEAALLSATPSLNKALWSLITQLNEESTLAMPPIWHLATIHVLTQMDKTIQDKIANKFMLDTDENIVNDIERISKKTGLNFDINKYRHFINVWRFNAHGHHTDENGLLLFDNVTFIAHSCAASASWYYADKDLFVLQARKLLAPGDEITISYLRDDSILSPTHLRRMELLPWMFFCQCNRCSYPVDYCRCFLCPSCATGEISIKTSYDDDAEIYFSSATPCTMCDYVFNAEQISHYEDLENSYIVRLEELTSNDLIEIENVYIEACRVFTYHHVMYQLDTLLQTGYADRGLIDQAASHIIKRLNYIKHCYPRVNFTAAGLWEELGDLYCSQLTDQEKLDGYRKNLILRAYENAFNSMIILCGEDHPNTLTPHSKFEMINSLEYEEYQA